jgi:hypothetical protein
MWTDINTKPKQGLVFQVFRKYVMGIPVGYRDVDYEGEVSLLPESTVSMPPLTVLTAKGAHENPLIDNLLC